MVSSSSACSSWLLVTVPPCLTNCGTLPNALSSPDLRYFAAFQMLSLSARNSFQCFFFCCRMASWYYFAAALAVSSRLTTICPARRSLRARFLQYVWMHRRCVKSVVHHRLLKGEGRAFGVRACTASNTADISVSVLLWTVPPDGLALSVFAIRALISFHGAFLSRSRSCRWGVGTGTSKTVSIAR